MKTIKKILNWIEVKICMWATNEKKPREMHWYNSVLIRKTETPNQKDFNTWIRYHKIYNHLWRL